MKKIVFITLLGILIASCKKTGDTPKTIDPVVSSPLDSLTMALDSIVANGPIVGLSAAILSKDTVYYNKGFGYANVTDSIMYTYETIQNIGSISKTFIGIALLKAQELGKLQLDDPVNDYLPFKVTNPKHTSIPITVRQLATHTSSIIDTDWYGKSYVMLHKEHPQTTHVLDYFSGPESDMTIEVYLKNVLTPNGTMYEPEVFAEFAPGATHEYSNIAATLAALVIEGATEMSFDVFTQQHILKPLNMLHSGWSNETIELSKRSKNFVHKDTLIADYKLITYPDGGMITSTNDLSRYLSELIQGYNGTGTLLSKEGYKELFKKQLTERELGEKIANNNTGIFIDYGKYGVGHNGGDPGVLTFMYFDPETAIGKLLFINTDYDSNQEVIKSFFKLWKVLESYESKL